MGRLASRVAILGFAAAIAAPVSASAEVFKLYGELAGGGAYGKGLAGDHADDAFSVTSRGGAYGLLAGGRVLIFDANLFHRQYLNGEETETWTQFNAGLNFGFDAGTEEQKKAHKGGYFEMGVWLGFGLGTGAQVDPPLDNSEVTDKGFVLTGRLGFGKHLSSIFDIGIAVPVSYAYLFKSGNGATANNTENQYQQVQIEALLVLRANLRFI
jgi:hypothetical protein